MPFQSEKQRRYLYAKKPSVAAEFAEKEKAVHKQDRYGGSGGHGRRITEAKLQEVNKAARYYDPEHRRQRKLGMAEAGLAGGGLAATGVGGTRAFQDSRKLRERVVQSNPNPNAPKVKVKDLPGGAGKGALRLTKTNAALLLGGLGATTGAAVVRQKAEGRRLGIWR